MQTPPESGLNIADTIRHTLNKNIQKHRDIYGSVTSNDVADSMRALLVGTEASSVVIGPENIASISDEDFVKIEDFKIKRLGEFQLELQVKGALEPIIRTVIVKDKEAAIFETARETHFEEAQKGGAFAAIP